MPDIVVHNAMGTEVLLCLTAVIVAAIDLTDYSCISCAALRHGRSMNIGAVIGNTSSSL